MSAGAAPCSRISANPTGRCKCVNRPSSSGISVARKTASGCSVAAAAGVDPALVMHYFGNKEGLFGAVSRLDISPPDLSGMAPEDVADVMLPLFVEVWGPDGPFLPLLRAASSSRQAADALPDAVARYIIGIPPLVDMDDHALADWLKPVMTHYLTDPSP